VDVAVHIDPLDRAAVEERPVGEILDRVIEIGIGSYVRRVLAAELQSDLEEAVRCRLLHAVPAGYGACKAHEVHQAAADDPRGGVMTEVQVLKDARGQPGRHEGLADPLGAERRLRRMLEDYRIARHQRRHDAVHRREVWVIPGRDDECDAERHFADEPSRARLVADLDIRERLLRDLDHVAGALLESVHLASEKLLGDLALERDAVGSMLSCHGLSSENPAPRSIPELPTCPAPGAHSRGR
jgi:hypothetical protein